MEHEAQVAVLDGLEVRDLAVDNSGDDCLVHGPVVQVDLGRGSISYPFVSCCRIHQTYDGLLGLAELDLNFTALGVGDGDGDCLFVVVSANNNVVVLGQSLVHSVLYESQQMTRVTMSLSSVTYASFERNVSSLLQVLNGGSNSDQLVVLFRSQSVTLEAVRVLLRDELGGQTALQHIENVLLNQNHAATYLQEALVGHDIAQEDDVVIDTADQVVVQGVFLSQNSLLTSLAVSDELGNERVVVNADLTAFFDTSINTARVHVSDTCSRLLEGLTECCGWHR